MAQVLVTESYLQDIADAIREKNGTENTYTPAQMAAAVEDIPTASPVLVQKSITANGEYDPEDDSADGYSAVTVNVPNTYSAGDEGKVVSGGALVTQTSKNIITNGTHDTTENNSVNVSVPNSYDASDEGKVVSSGELVSQTSKSISENGTYDTTLNNSVIVNVSGGGGGGSSTILTGDTAPSTSEGNDGDIYLQTIPVGVLSDGATYVNTGINGGSDVEFEIDFLTYNRIVSSSSWSKSVESYGCIMGSRHGGSNKEFQLSTFATSASNNDTKGTFGYNGTRYTPYMTRNVMQHIELHDHTLTDNDGNTLSISTTAWSGDYPIYVFGLNNAGSALQYGILVLFGLKIWQNGTLVRNYSPAKVNDVACLYDAVNDNYVYPSSGTLAYLDSGEIIASYCKVNGAWQELIGTNIDDVNLGD